MKHTYPLSQAQIGVFLECQENPTTTRYNLGGILTLPQHIDLSRLEKAVYRIIAARPVLHTRFFIDDEGTPRQYPDMDMNIPVLRKHMRDAELHEYVRTDFSRPFTMIGCEPLCRYAIVETEKHNYLLYNVHHTLTDGLTTLSLFPKQDLPDAYAGKELTPEDKTLYDFALEEEQQMKSAEYAAAAEYYKAKFVGKEFADLARGATTNVGRALLVYERIPSAPIDAWSEAHGLRPNAILQAAFGLVLSRLCRAQEVAYTSVRHGRFDKALMHTYGMFAKTVPVLAELPPTMKVEDYVRATAEEWKSTYRMADYSFPQLCREMQSRPAVTYSYQGEKLVRTYELDGGEMAFEQIDKGVSDMNLTCLVYVTEDSYELRMEASDALYDETYLHRYACAMRNCVEQMMQQSDSTIGEIEIVSEEEKKEFIALGTGETLEYDRSDTLVSLFRRQAALTPDNIAVVYKDHKYTYREIDEITDRIATNLAGRYGVGLETVVGVMIDRSEWMVLYPLAIMKAGGVYMPLDSHFPEDRLTYMIADAGVRLILTEDNLVGETLPHFDGAVLTTAEAAEQPTFEGAVCSEAKPENAYIILYTSGSTGRPKGCVLEHDGMVNFCHAYIKSCTLTSADSSAAYANFGFDAHMIDIYPILAVGGSVHILASDIRMDLTAIHQYMEKGGITVSSFTTQIGIQMASLFTFTQLRIMSVGGEKLMPIQKPTYHFINVYGPTETTIACTGYELRRDNEDAPIGRPVAGYTLYVMDHTMHLVPKGMAGELCIAGVGVARGYLNNPEMTAEKFVTINGERMYRTGDLVRWDEEGNLVFIGRMDNQVKLRGLRIEIGEIETVLSQYDGIMTPAVMVQEVNGVQMLCAYFTSDSDIDIKALKAYLGESLTDFMVPEIYIRMDSMPLTPNGKVNRRVLPVPEMEKGEIVAPETEMEKDLFDIVAEQLHTTDFGVTTNLITMGLTSIGAIKLSVQIHKKIGVQLKTKDIMKTPTICQWAALLGSGQQEE